MTAVLNAASGWILSHDNMSGLKAVVLGVGAFVHVGLMLLVLGGSMPPTFVHVYRDCSL